MRITLYCVTNRKNGKRYVGQTRKTVEARWRGHVNSASCKVPGRHCRVLNAAIRKYGAEVFAVQPLDVVTTQRGADAAEKAWIQQRNTCVPFGYNLRLGGGVREPCDETRQRIREGVRRHLASESIDAKEARAAKSRESNRRYYATETEEAKELRKAKARAASPKRVAALRETVSKRTPEERRAIGEAIRAKWLERGEEERAEIAHRRQEALGPERRSDIKRKMWAAMTPERRSEIRRNWWASLTPEERSAIGKKSNDAQTPEERSARQRRAAAKLSPEERSERMRKAWITRRSKSKPE